MAVARLLDERAARIVSTSSSAMLGSRGSSTQESQTAWRWLSTRSRLARSRSGGFTSPCTISRGSRKKYWSCGLCDDE
jgi:hypothetical protein